MEETLRDGTEGPKGNDVPKRPYEKPAVIWRNSLSVSALSIGCAWHAGEDTNCNAAPSS